MRAPLFWHKSRRKLGFLSIILSPLAWAWHRGSVRRLANGPWEKLSVPVICVGNINVGGTGKTPTVIALQSLLADRGIAAHIVSKGYGGTEIGPIKVIERDHSAAQMGDEPMLMAAFGPVWVSKDRALGAKAAIKDGAQAILLDDGFQNPALHQDLSIVVIDAEVGFGNGKVMPAGPLRENLITGLARANLIVSIGNSTAQTSLTDTWPEIAGIERLNAHLAPLQTGMDWKGLRAIAFAGIGRPGKFFNTLKDQGANIIAAHSFADHGTYSDAVLNRLKAEAQKSNAQLVTTEKDAARLPASFRPNILTLPVRLKFGDQASLTAILDRLFS
ncbi:MAG: tetraacyldisaccharide 4'-kinase [Rhodobacteraceae bacterium]|nr:tetraacyldisaccharide 4'-kinase [Paracoccaceae bacterium]